MKVAQLLSIYPQLRWGEVANQDVTGIFDDSREMKSGGVFVAVRGHKIDGHDHIQMAINQGALAIVLEDISRLDPSFKGAVVKVSNSRLALNQLANRFYKEPFEDIFCVGVTGTNGKTSITYMIESILNEFGWISGVMGTIDHHVGNHHWKSELTTPGSLLLHRRMSEFVSLGARAALFEVSSHALSQHRVDSIPFKVGIFTNLTRDHLDYHGTLENYFLAKQNLFKELPQKQQNKYFTAVINIDDSYGQKLEIADGVKRWTYGKNPSDFKFKIKASNFDGVIFDIETPRGFTTCQLPMPGEHNVYNAVASIAAAMEAGVSLETCVLALSKFKGVPGRLQKVENKLGLHIFVDYAHTDNALEMVLKGLRKIEGNYKLWTVFGCGGNRDQGKRPLMMNAAKLNSDFVIVTSDNPRNEDPLKIIRDSLEVVSSQELNHTILVEPDRKKAMQLALNSASKGDVILVAGKGHEDYQIIGDQKFVFSDVKVIEELLVSLNEK